MEKTALKLAIALGAAQSAIASIFTKLQQIEERLDITTQDLREVKHQVAQLAYLSQDLDAIASQKQDDSDLLTQFFERVDTQLAQEAIAPEIDTPSISAEEFWERYKAGERDFSGINLIGINFNLQKQKLDGLNFSRANLTRADISGLRYLYNVNLCEARLSQFNPGKFEE
ncbi:MAG: pentapeptide repeat-containing protein [Hydrococcus sp. Prado102]|jgi:uncharacterized protein YjbI with pentapeptide repeats|nr:pentapeptide repeat-containing protein [Hydrococcus sp. Prado102]